MIVMGAGFPPSFLPILSLFPLPHLFPLSPSLLPLSPSSLFPPPLLLPPPPPSPDPNNTAKGYLGTPARFMTVTVKGVQMRLKWCPTCNIWRPPRASHCGLCNNCYGERTEAKNEKILAKAEGVVGLTVQYVC